MILTPQALLPLPATPVSLIVQQDISSLLGYYEVLIARKNDQLYLVNFTSGTNGQVRVCCCTAFMQHHACAVGCSRLRFPLSSLGVTIAQPPRQHTTCKAMTQCCTCCY